jgi:hypothetical protein
MRQDQFRYTVSLDDAPIGVWDKSGGGDLDSDEVKYAPGGMAAEVSLGGRQTASNLTLDRLFEQGRDDAQFQTLANRRGKGRIVASGQPLDEDGNAFGRPLIRTGTLKRVSYPDHDSTSNAAAMVQIEITLDAQVSA